MEKFDGLTLVFEIDLSEPDYSFYLLGVWVDDDGGYYMGTDSGCSCPTPWENYGGKEDLTGPLTAGQVREEAYSLFQGYEPEEFYAALAGLN